MVAVVVPVVVAVEVLVEHESQSPGHKRVKFISRPPNLNMKPHASSPTRLQSLASSPPSAHPCVVVVTVEVPVLVPDDVIVLVPVLDCDEVPDVDCVLEPVLERVDDTEVVADDDADVVTVVLALELALVVAVDVIVVVCVATHASQPAGHSVDISDPKKASVHPRFSSNAHMSTSIFPPHIAGPHLKPFDDAVQEPDLIEVVPQSLLSQSEHEVACKFSLYLPVAHVSHVKPSTSPEHEPARYLPTPHCLLEHTLHSYPFVAPEHVPLRYSSDWHATLAHLVQDSSAFSPPLYVFDGHVSQE